MTISDATINWYGGKGKEGRVTHNRMQISTLGGIKDVMEAWNDALEETNTEE